MKKWSLTGGLNSLFAIWGLDPWGLDPWVVKSQFHPKVHVTWFQTIWKPSSTLDTKIWYERHAISFSQWIKHNSSQKWHPARVKLGQTSSSGKWKLKISSMTTSTMTSAPPWSPGWWSHHGDVLMKHGDVWPVILWETDGISWNMMGWTHQMIHGNKDDVMV